MVSIEEYLLDSTSSNYEYIIYNKEINSKCHSTSVNSSLFFIEPKYEDCYLQSIVDLYDENNKRHI